MKIDTSSTIVKIDNLIIEAQAEIKKHNLDDDYWGTEKDIQTSNSFFDKAGMLLGIDIAEDDKWTAYLIKATSVEAYEFAIGQLSSLKETLSKQGDRA